LGQFHQADDTELAFVPYSKKEGELFVEAKLAHFLFSLFLVFFIVLNLFFL
jgi:hypothetical protein